MPVVCLPAWHRQSRDYRMEVDEQISMKAEGEGNRVQSTTTPSSMNSARCRCRQGPLSAGIQSVLAIVMGQSRSRALLAKRQSPTIFEQVTLEVVDEFSPRGIVGYGWNPHRFAGVSLDFLA